MAASIVVLAVTFNLFLALINAHITGLSKTHIILSELLIIGAAFGTTIIFWQQSMMRWVWLLWFMIITFLVLSAMNDRVEPKLARDVVLIPIFIMLGIVYAKGNVIRLVCILQTTVLAIMVFEGALPEAFGSVFNIQSFYINTRDFIEDQFWNENSNLFVSATRPNSRFLLEGIGIHRLSSLHLEPVSLGNWAIIITIFTVAFRHKMTMKTLAFLIISNLLILIGCDGRLATVTIGILILASFFFPYIPRKVLIFYLPASLILSYLVVTIYNLPPSGDDFPGRLSHSMQTFTNLDLIEYFGIAHSRSTRGADSGITYFVLTQSVIGVVVIWLSVCLLQPMRDRTSLIIAHTTALYISLTLLVSYSFFSIKSAALLWFLYGVAYQQALSETDQPKEPWRKQHNPDGQSRPQTQAT